MCTEIKIPWPKSWDFLCLLVSWGGLETTASGLRIRCFPPEHSIWYGRV